MLDKEVIDYTTLKADDFYNKAYSIIFEAMINLNADNKAVDLVTLIDKVPELTPELYHELTTEGMRTTNFKHWQEIIIEKSKLRKYIEIMQTSLDLAFEGNDPTDNLRLLEDIETKNETDMKHISQDASISLFYVIALRHDVIKTSYRV